MTNLVDFTLEIGTENIEDLSDEKIEDVLDSSLEQFKKGVLHKLIAIKHIWLAIKEIADRAEVQEHAVSE